MAIAYTGNEFNETLTWASGTSKTTAGTATINAGDGVAVCVRSEHTAGNTPLGLSNVSDSVVGNYTFAAKQEVSDPDMYVYVYPNHSGGSPTFTITYTDSSAHLFVWIEVITFTGCATSSMVGATAVKFFTPGGSPTDHTSDAFNGTATNSVIIGWASSNNFITYTAGPNGPNGFTLVNGSLGNFGGSHFGGSEYQILTGSAYTSTQADITASPGYGSWTFSYVELLAAGAGGSAGGPLSFGGALVHGALEAGGRLAP